ncbi:vesicle-associated membrane protein 7 [Vigna unguiculata]|uniref:Vesicle-associated membrane protein 7 n=1 Tax=Vigna unguiculata TaxID=3917 RepID=A0A4D6MY51_VIGUN|nr:vesicle-associated membrane protein 7 [Vigna unguiculata]
MGQQSLIYSFVARGTMILAEYTEFSGNFTTIASQCLQKLPSTNNRFTYNCDGHTFNYLVETYCVVAVESAGRQLPIAFLERVKEEFSKKYGAGKAATASAKSLNREFGCLIEEKRLRCWWIRLTIFAHRHKTLEHRAQRLKGRCGFKI